MGILAACILFAGTMAGGWLAMVFVRHLWEHDAKLLAVIVAASLFYLGIVVVLNNS